MRGWSADGFDENHDEHAERATMSCAFDRDPADFDEFKPNGIEPVIEMLAESDLAGEIYLATVDDDVAEQVDEWATEWAVYIAFECGNCHNILRLMPKEAIDQVFDAEGWVLCECGAPIAEAIHRGTWTP